MRRPIHLPETGIDTIKQLTLNDIEVGIGLADALAHHAAAGKGAAIGPAELLTLTRLRHPKDDAVDRAVPVGLGMKLRFVEDFCRANAFPNLASLVAHPAAGGVADGERQAAAAFDWAGAGTGFHARLAAFAGEARAAVPRRLKPRKERPADVAWYAYFCAHREACKEITGEDKKEIINLLMSGLDPESALRRVLAAKAELAAA